MVWGGPLPTASPSQSPSSWRQRARQAWAIFILQRDSDHRSIHHIKTRWAQGQSFRGGEVQEGQRLRSGRGRWADRQGPKKKTNHTEQGCWGLLPTLPNPSQHPEEQPPNITGPGSTQGQRRCSWYPLARRWHLCPTHQGQRQRQLSSGARSSLGRAWQAPPPPCPSQPPLLLAQKPKVSWEA